MKKSLSALEAKKADQPQTLPQRGVSPALARRQAHQQLEELKVRVLELAQRNMEVSLRVLKRWIGADSQK